jgi:pyruvate kinase
MQHDADGTTGRSAEASTAVATDASTGVSRAERAAPAVGALLRQIEALRRAAAESERERAGDVADCSPEARDGARNLLHYVAVRRHDLRPLQEDLARLGLSSLGRMDAHVAATLAAVDSALRALAGEQPRRSGACAHIDYDGAHASLAGRASRVLGPERGPRATRIMVTLPTESADDPTLLDDLLAHDDPAVWSRMLERLDAARARTGRDCRVAFDLAGPKLRTGPMAPGPAVLKLRPERDPLGQVVAPARVTLVPALRDRPARPGALPVSARLLRRAVPDDVFELIDARGRARRLRVVTRDADGHPVCETDRTAYLVPGTVLTHRRGRRALADGEIGALPASTGGISLALGDRLDLAVGPGPGLERLAGLDGREARPAVVACDSVELFRALAPGLRVLFDDGRIEAVVHRVEGDRARLEIVRCAGGRATLRAGKGINVPDARIDLPALTARDLEHLAFAAPRAHLVSASFVRTTADVDALRDALADCGAHEVALVLKIETAEAFARLPDLLLSALRHPGGVAVMVARGDLAVEVGFERLAEVQEEILWLCEAAHVPVIWATQVLDGLARDGAPSRAEVTDAAASGRAECVMLNKGPHVVDAVRFLSDVLDRMQAHQRKKTTMLRALAVSGPPAPVH